MIKIGLVGCGKVARSFHLPCYQEIKDTRVVAVCDVNGRKARYFASRYRIPKTYTDFSKMLGNNDLDMVDICTPGYTHYQLCLAAIEHGFNVLVEKPIALSLREAIDIRDSSLKRHVKVCVVQNYRFRRPVIEALRMYKEGRIGKIVEVVSTYHDLSPFSEPSWTWDEKMSGGLLYEFATIHFVDLQTLFCGKHKRVLSVYAKRNDKLRYTTDVYALIEFENGAVGILDIRTLSSSHMGRFDIYGTASDIHLKFYPDSFYSASGAIIPYAEFISEMRRFFGFTKHALFQGMGRYRMKYHLSLISSYIDALKRDEEPPISLQSVIDTMSLLEDLKISLSKCYG